jgi:hypothetical protein
MTEIDIDDPKIEWSSQLEDIIAQEGEKCRGLSWLHTRGEALTSKYNTCVQVPVIILSTLAGTASVGSQTLFGGSSVSSTAIGLALKSQRTTLLDLADFLLDYCDVTFTKCVEKLR